MFIENLLFWAGFWVLGIKVDKTMHMSAFHKREVIPHQWVMNA